MPHLQRDLWPTLQSIELVVSPKVTIRAATDEERERLVPWQKVVAKRIGLPHVVDYHGGSSTHSPEVISKLRALMASYSAPVALLYVHRGYWSQCLTPLLQSLLYATGHEGDAFSLRSESHVHLTDDVKEFAIALLTEEIATCVIVDDRQHRVGFADDLHPAPVVLTAFSREAAPPYQPEAILNIAECMEGR